ncbi:Alpha-crystallin domain-containing protein 22.3 [Bienertia sinuspersici]
MASPPIRPPHQPALSVTPLNSMPYIDPITSHGNDDSFQPQGDVEPVEPAKPALIYLPSQPTEEERNQILSVTHNGVCLTGSAALGSIGPVVGKINISESKDTYLFRVGLPGVARDEFTCDVAPDGRILIKGVTTTGEKIVYKNSMKFVMQSQNLCPPGHFSISFQLPGPVDSQDLTGHFGIDGIFEGIVKKKIPST